MQGAPRAGLLSLPNDVLRLILVQLPSASVLALRLVCRRFFAVEEACFALLLARITTMQPLISEAAVARVLVKVFRKPLFLTRESSSVQLVARVDHTKRELLARRVYAASFRDPRQQYSQATLHGGFLAESCHLLADDEVFCAGNGLLRCTGFADARMAATERCEMPFEEAIFISCSVLLRDGARVVVGANSGELGLLGLPRGEAMDLPSMQQWMVSRVSGGGSGSGVSSEVVAVSLVSGGDTLVTTAAHCIEQRDLAAQAVTRLTAANKLLHEGKRVGWRNPRGKLQDTVCLEPHLLAVSGEENLLLCDLRTEDLVVGLLNSNATKLGHSYCIRSLAAERHGQLLYSGGGDGNVCLWDLRRNGGCAAAPLARAAAAGSFVVDVRVDCDNVFVSYQEGHVQQFKRDLSAMGLRLGAPGQGVLSYDVRADSVVACFNTGQVDLFRVAF